MLMVLVVLKLFYVPVGRACAMAAQITQFCTLGSHRAPI
jgi:hypothetical protein